MYIDDSGSLPARPADCLQLRHDDGAGFSGRRLRDPLCECNRRGLDPDFASSMVVWAAMAGIAGSRLYAVLDDLPAYLADPRSIIFSGSGFVFYGGLIGGLLVVILCRRAAIESASATTADMCRPGAGDRTGARPHRMPALGRRRLGNAVHAAMGDGLSQRDRGMEPAHGAEARRQYHLVSGFFPGVRVHPTPIYEAILYVACLRFCGRCERAASAGHIFYLYLMLAGSGALRGRVPARQSASLHGAERGATDCDRHDDSSARLVLVIL